MPRQCIEQFLIHRRVSGSQIIDRFNKAMAKIMGPNAIGCRTRKVRIGRMKHPVGKRLAAVGQIGGNGSTAQGPCRYQHLGPRVFQVYRRPCNNRLGSVWQNLLTDAGKESRKRDIVVLPPLFRGMMMALRAFNPHPQKQLAHRPRHGFRVIEHLVK